MTDSDISSVIELLTHASVEDSDELDFAGRGLKLNSEHDAQEIVEAILKCNNLITLKLEGNTLGVTAAKAIAKALKLHPEFKRALWKDLFTGRLKTEIPDALNFLSGGLTNAKLTELDLSDNAFGPIGVKGIQNLIASPTCFQLQELRLNNNGLGITGGKLLADALIKCHQRCAAASLVFSLRVFICGRNRLENEGAEALSQFFNVAGTLEEVSMPQNGIYHDGIAALASSFSKNPNLQVINLNDNTATEIGGRAIATAIYDLNKLRIINLGDCLLRCAGATSLAAAITKNHQELEELHVGFNEIRTDAALVVLDSLKNKTKLVKVDLDGNLFGLEGCEKVEEMFQQVLPGVLESLSEDEGLDNGDDDSCNTDNDLEEDVDEIEIPVHSSLRKTNSDITAKHDVPSIPVTAKEFLESPTAEKFLALGDDRSCLIMEEINNDLDFDRRISTVLKLSSCVSLDNEEVKDAAFECADALLMEVFELAEKQDRLSVLSNSLLVQLGLIKSEDKTFKPMTDLTGPLIVLEHVVRQPYFSRITKEILQLFLSRPNKAIDACGSVKHKWLQTLYSF
uniref:Ran-GTPase activating protein 1 C-terminal domain-containing protein n=1 Tax=Strigamia maritima TaxID=126957 RepID=T1IIM9_STRMM